LSYDLDAYTEEMIDGKVSEPWKQLHDETIDVLFEISKLDKYNIYIKPHPQYHGTYLKKLVDESQYYPNISIVPNSADARLLITQNDIIVGFQTTALFEAMIIGKKIVYTFWTESVNILKNRLLKFHEFDECISVSKSKLELKSLLLDPTSIIGGDNITESLLNHRINRFESILGKSDGRSSLRVLENLDNLYNKFKNLLSDEQNLLRKSVLNNNEQYIKKELLISKSNLIKLKIISILTLLPIIGKKIKPYINTCVQYEKLRLNELFQNNNTEIIGSTNFSVLFFFKGLILKKL